MGLRPQQKAAMLNNDTKLGVSFSYVAGSQFFNTTQHTKHLHTSPTDDSSEHDARLLLLTWYSRMSAAMSTGYVMRPALTSSPCFRAFSLN